MVNNKLVIAVAVCAVALLGAIVGILHDRFGIQPTLESNRSVQYPPGALTPDLPAPSPGIIARRVEPIINAVPFEIAREDPPVELKSGPIPVPGAPKKRGRGVYYGPPTSDQLDQATPRAVDGQFNSIDFDSNGAVTGGFRFIPPDSHVAAGPDHVIVVANVSIRIHQKDGTVLLDDSLQNFFAPLSPATFTFDPKVIYDQYSDRWVVITLEVTDVAAGDPADTSLLLIAVSDDADPFSGWTMASINTVQNIGGNLTWADYPGLGLDDEGIYITTNQFNFGSFPNTFANRLWAIEKGEGTGGFYDGNAPNVVLLDPALSFPMTVQSSHMFGPPPAQANTFLTGYSGLSGGGTSFLQVLRLWDIFTSPSGNQQFVAIGVIEGNPTLSYQNAPQSGTGTRVSTNDKRTLNSVWRDDLLWNSMTIGPPAGTAQTSAHWNRVDTSNLGSLTIDSFGSIDGEDVATNTWAFFPSIAVNELGDAALGYSTSASSIFPSAHYALMSGENPTSFGPSQLLAAGVDFYIRTFGGPRNRWGDYSGAAVDPANQCFWLYNEYAQTRGTLISGEEGRWGTAVLKYCPCTETITLTGNQWLLYTPSCNMGDDNTIGETFGDVLNTADYGAGAGDTWVVYRRNATAQTYEIPALTDPLVEGQGYWIKTLGGNQSLRVDGIANVGLDIPLVGDAAGRLNMVGHPHDFDVCWADATVFDGVTAHSLDDADPVLMSGPNAGQRACAVADPSCIMSRVMQQWNGTAHFASDGISSGMQGTLEPMLGMWVEAFQSGLSLRVPRIAGSSCTSAAPPRAVGGDWHLRLSVQAQEMNDYAVLGRTSDALFESDYHDLPEFTPFGNRWITIVFPHTDWSLLPGDYQSDFRPLGQAFDEWAFEVRISDPSLPTTLTWQGPSDEIEGALLWDVESGELIAPQAGGQYVFQPASGSHRFVWLSGASNEWIFGNGFEGNGL